MPLPPGPLTINGGCHCKAIRYRIDIPEINQRPFHPTLTTKSMTESDCRQPYIGICHCNSCRSASGTILPSWLCTPAEMIHVAVSPNTNDFRPGLEMLAPADEISQVDLIKFYHSSPKVSRAFCGNCGTNISFYERPNDGGPHVIDICPGSIDRTDLEKDWMIPERQLHWANGIDWIEQLTLGKSGVEHAPRHPHGNVGEIVDK